MADIVGYTPLMEAAQAQAQDVERVRGRLAAGDAVDETNRFGVTALQLAARWSYKDEAVGVELVGILLDAGADINKAEDEQGLTPLMYAAIHGSLPVVKLLIARGADVNRKARDKKTVLKIIRSTPVIAKKRNRIMTAIEAAGGV